MIDFTKRDATMNEQQVKIGPEFFRKIKLDYADWRWALVREFLQNCFDAPGSRNVEVTVESNGDATILTVVNDGASMDRDTLVNKLLTLGGSGKNFEGENTGGFGVAKSLLYYCHQNYVITTGNLTVRGSGAQYAISERETTEPGTRSMVAVDGDEASELRDAVRKFAGMAQWKGTLKLDGEVLATDLRKGARRKDVGFGVVYTNNSFSNTCIVRLNGQPMFSTWTRFKGCVLIELTGKACQVLTSNRDGLVRPFSSQLNDLLTSLAVDKKSALREQQAEYKRYAGELQRNEAKKPKEAELGLSSVIDVGQLAALVRSFGEMGGGATTEAAPETAQGGIRMVVVSKEDEQDRSISVGPQFILKNATGMKTPSYYTPGDGFSRYSRDLVRCWTGLLLKLHQVCDRSGEFSVGFVFDEESEAESEKGVYGQVYYVNPVKVVTNGKRRMEARWDGAWQARFELISVACHEFVHGAYGLGEHDEDYAGKLTEVTAKAMEHMEELVNLCRPAKVVAPIDEGAVAVPFRRQHELMGHAATSVVRWMGARGWSYSAVRDTLACYDITLAEATIRTMLYNGRKGEQSIPTLTEQQSQELEALYRKYG